MEIKRGFAQIKPRFRKLKRRVRKIKRGVIFMKPDSIKIMKGDNAKKRLTFL